MLIHVWVVAVGILRCPRTFARHDHFSGGVGNVGTSNHISSSSSSSAPQFPEGHLLVVPFFLLQIVESRGKRSAFNLSVDPFRLPIFKEECRIPEPQWGSDGGSISDAFHSSMYAFL
jgi:hypothetical protein